MKATSEVQFQHSGLFHRRADRWEKKISGRRVEGALQSSQAKFGLLKIIFVKKKTRQVAFCFDD